MSCISARWSGRESVFSEANGISEDSQPRSARTLTRWIPRLEPPQCVFYHQLCHNGLKKPIQPCLQIWKYNLPSRISPCICCLVRSPKGNSSRNNKFADSPDDVRNTEGRHQAGEHRTDLCVGWEGYCQAGSPQLQVEEWYSWCCWGPPGHSSQSQGRTRCPRSWLSPRGPEMRFGEADVFVTVILRSQRCWKTLSLTKRHKTREGGYEGPQSPSDTVCTWRHPSQTAQASTSPRAAQEGGSHSLLSSVPRSISTRPQTTFLPQHLRPLSQRRASSGSTQNTPPGFSVPKHRWFIR